MAMCIVNTPVAKSGLEPEWRWLPCTEPCALPPLYAGIVRASSVFPILSTILLLLGGLCVGVGRLYSGKNNILLSAGILFVAAGKPPGLAAPSSPRREGASPRREARLVWERAAFVCSPASVRRPFELAVPTA